MKIRFDLSSLYYRPEEDIVLSHTKKSSGNRIDVRQVIAGKDEIFIERAPDKALEKKKIILRGWYFDYEDQEFTSFYNELSNLGFEIFQVSLGKIQRIHGYREILRTYISEDQAKEAIKTYGYTKDEVFIAGSDEICRLIGKKSIEIQYKHVKDDSTFNLIKHHLDENTYSEVTLILEAAPDYTGRERIYSIKNEIDHAVFDSALGRDDQRHLVISLIKCKTLKFTPKSTCDYASLLIPSSIQQIIYECNSLNINERSLKAFTKISSLRSKEIDISDFEQENFILFLENLKKLQINIESLKISSLSISFDQLQDLLSISGEVREIILHRVTFIGERRSINIPASVNKIKFRHAKLSFEDIKIFIQKAPGIENLGIVESSSLDSSLEIEEQNNPNYKEKIYSFFYNNFVLLKSFLGCFKLFHFKKKKMKKK